MVFPGSSAIATSSFSISSLLLPIFKYKSNSAFINDLSLSKRPRPTVTASNALAVSPVFKYNLEMFTYIDGSRLSF